MYLSIKAYVNPIFDRELRQQLSEYVLVLEALQNQLDLLVGRLENVLGLVRGLPAEILSPPIGRVSATAIASSQQQRLLQVMAGPQRRRRLTIPPT